MEKTDIQLLQSAVEGNSGDLEALVLRHYDYIYNVSVRMVFFKQDALDLTQDIIIKVISNLASFKTDHNFKGWLYRLTVNHFLNMKKRPVEKNIVSFSSYGEGLDAIKDSYYDVQDSIEADLILKEVKISCTRGMLMCLSREQRLLYVFGEILEIDHKLGAFVFDTTPENYRQKLSRARKELQNFMNEKCSLVDTRNPCKCRNKTKGFIENGWVSPTKHTFTQQYKHLVNEVIRPISEHIENELPLASKRVFQGQPYYNPDNKFKLLKDLKLDPL